MNLAKACFQTIVILSLSIAANSKSSNQGIRGTPIGIGDPAPAFSLEDQNGHKVTLSEARPKSPVVLVFYRGYW